MRNHRYRSRGKINFNLIIFAAVVGLLIGYPAYLYIHAEITGGIVRQGNGVTQVDLKAMSTFDFDQIHGRNEDIPQRWRNLNGQKVVMYGEMWAPNSMAPQVSNFDLCYSIAKCCFSGPPQVQHFVKSNYKNGVVDFHSGQVKVTGVLHVNVKEAAGQVESVYQLDVDKVEPAM